MINFSPSISTSNDIIDDIPTIIKVGKKIEQHGVINGTFSSPNTRRKKGSGNVIIMDFDKMDDVSTVAENNTAVAMVKEYTKKEEKEVTKERTKMISQSEDIVRNKNIKKAIKSKKEEAAMITKNPHTIGHHDDSFQEPRQKWTQEEEQQKEKELDDDQESSSSMLFADSKYESPFTDYTGAFLTTPHLSNIDKSTVVVHAHWDWHPSQRVDRFPSVEDRLKIYMGNWYVPPCNGLVVSSGNNNKTQKTDERLLYEYDYSLNTTFPDVQLFEVFQHTNVKTGEPRFINMTIPTTASLHQPHALWNEALWLSNINGTELCFYDNDAYCLDMRLMAIAVQKITDTTHLSQIPPLFATLGDLLINGIGQYPVPTFQKARYATTMTNLKEITTDTPGRCWNNIGSTREGLVVPAKNFKDIGQKRWHYHSIIWPFTMGRHFKPEIFRSIYHEDIPWEQKANVAVWRGSFTNRNIECEKAKEGKNSTFVHTCDCNPRCRMVKMYLNSSLVDAKFTNLPTRYNFDFPDDMIGKRLANTKLLHYKAIVSIEGNDVASGLKWQLFSSSVVIMPVPTRTSYAMEEVLEPWVHFIPVENEDMSDLEDKVQWVLDHDKEAQIIAERGKLFMADLLYHKDSIKDNNKIYEEILKRYLRFFKK